MVEPEQERNMSDVIEIVYENESYRPTMICSRNIRQTKEYLLCNK